MNRAGLLAAFANAEWEAADPGNAGALPTGKTCLIPIVTAAAETRTGDDPVKGGILMTLAMKTDGGDCVITFDNAVDEAGTTVLTLDDAGDYYVLMSVPVGTAYRWRIIASGNNAALIEGITATAAELNVLAGVVAGTATAGKALVLGSAKEATTLGAFTFAGINYTPVARTATADGLTTGIIADAGMLQFVTVTSADANHIIVLPTPTPGTIVILRNGATGYELRTSTPASISINGGAASNGESAIAANTMVIAICTSATTWQAIGLAGTTLAAVEAAA